MGKTVPKNRSVTIALIQADYDDLEAIASERDMSMAEAARMILRGGLQGWNERPESKDDCAARGCRSFIGACPACGHVFCSQHRRDGHFCRPSLETQDAGVVCSYGRCSRERINGEKYCSKHRSLTVACPSCDAAVGVMCNVAARPGWRRTISVCHAERVYQAADVRKAWNGQSWVSEVRMEDGVVTKITVNNPGAGYAAPPKEA